MGPEHHQHLLQSRSRAQGELLGKCNQQLIRESFNCPECGTVLIDMGTDPEAMPKSMPQSRPYPCLKCNKGVMAKGRLLPVRRVSRHSGPIPSSVCLTWSSGASAGEGTKSQLALQQFQTLEEFQKSLPPHVLQMMGASLFWNSSKQRHSLRLRPHFRAEAGRGTGSTSGSSALELPAASDGDTRHLPFRWLPQQPVNMGQHAVLYPGPAPFQAPVKPNFSK